MATIDSKELIDILIRNNGWYPGDNIQVTRIVEYTNSFGKKTWGIVYSNENQERYAASAYILNPRVIFLANQDEENISQAREE